MVRLVVVALVLSSGLLAVTSEGQSTQQPPDTTLRFGPDTGELIPAQPAPAATTPPAAGTTRLTEQSTIALARADARRRHSGLAWVLGGGLLGAGAMGAGGGMVLSFTGSFGGYLLGGAVGASSVPLVVSLLPVSVPEPPQLEDATPGQRVIYRQVFVHESRKLRRTSVIKTELVIAGGFLFLLLMGS